ncbi:hypothetical protein GCM10010974_28100 [Brevibacterium sediminis]|uniref:Alcohol dehydrogenase-like C-terminal domain-containing protein n=1 Tax=Brevibacterium sediminis TaxID=1857024 RepID=A0ABQ1MNX2_9MICO|nr:hypothetical protein GCM10010974_28100 [Brevibacterium sediminis]
MTGGAGAVGHAAIQLARWSGAEVITTVSSRRKAALASAAGADHVINYREGAAAAEIRKIAANGVDQIVEVAPSANAALDSQVLANHGTVAVYATEGQPLNLDVWPHLATNTRYQFVLLYTVGNTALRAAADDIVNALKDRALPVGEEAGLPLTRFELDRTSDAHDAVQANAIGKVLIDVSSHPFGADTTAGAE